MDYWKGKCQRMGNVFARVHQALFASVNFECALPFVARQNSFDSEALLTADPVWLHQGALANNLPTFKEVTVGITSESGRLDFCGTFHVRWHEKADLQKLQTFNSDQAGIIVWKLQVQLEIRWARCRKG